MILPLQPLPSGGRVTKSPRAGVGAAWGLLLAVLMSVPPLAAAAQDDGAALVADSLLVTEDERLVATGNVQAFYEGTVVSAARVTYDRQADRLLIEGPILIRDADGNVLTAERAQLDRRLEDGLLQGARLVLDRQLQIAASRIDRLGPVTALTGTAATSCQVCPGRAPLWEIRAGQIIRDEEAQQLYLENARFLVRGVPILWLPRLRLPEPTNERASGLLIPSLRASDELGFGVQVPYFLVLGPSRDLLLAPLVAANTLSLEARYRQAFLNGDLELRGAVSRDDLRPDSLRGYATAEGAFQLPADLAIAFDVTAVSDDDYLDDYTLGGGDRLESVLRLSRVGEASLFESEVVATQSLDDDAEVPLLQGSASVVSRREAMRGTLTYGSSVDGLLRAERTAGEVDRDVLRAGAFAGWQAGTVLGYGVLLEGEARAAVDAYRVTDDAGFDDSILRATPAVAATLRWPLLRRGGDGSSDLLEPVTSLGWTGALGGEPPNEDARLPELDEANLHALAGLPGEDEVEEGGRLALGMAWTRATPAGTSILSFGRVLRTEDLETSGASGLGGTASDWLLAGRVDLDAGFDLAARTLLDADLDLGKAEARVGWSGEAARLGLAYVRLPADPLEDRADEVEELSLDGTVEASDRWILSGTTRYDLAREEPERVGLGVVWRNECVEVDVEVARRYTTADDGDGSTEFGLSVNLLGFSADDGPRVQPGACRD